MRFWGILLALVICFLAGLELRGRTLRVKPLNAEPKEFVVRERIEEGRNYHWECEVKNPNNEEATISAITLTCGCTRIGSELDFPEVLGPGETLPVEFLIDTEAMDGERILHATFEASCRSQPVTVTVACKLTVAASLHAVPNTIALGEIRTGEQIRVPVILADDLPNGYSVLHSVDVSNSAVLSVNWEQCNEGEVERRGRKIARRYSLLIHYRAPAEVRSREKIIEEVVLNISSGRKGIERRIPVSGQLVPFLEFFPSTGVISAGQLSGSARVIVAGSVPEDVPKIVSTSTGCYSKIAADGDGQFLLTYRCQSANQDGREHFVEIQYQDENAFFLIEELE